MPWGPDPNFTGLLPRLGWGGPPPAPAEPRNGWQARPWRTSGFAGEGQLVAAATYIPWTVGALEGEGQLQAAGVPRLYANAALSGDSATTAAAWAHLYPGSAPEGDGQLTATAAFPPFADASVSIEQTGAYRIPWWCIYLDVIAIGGGGGGRGGGGAFAGSDAGHGEWAAVTLQRGVDIPWNVSTLQVTLGAGGAGGAGGYFPANGYDGIATTIGSYLTAAGGLGAYNNSQLTPAAGTYTYRGRTYQGGAANTAPGGGGKGGAAGVFGGRPGDPGAVGRAWITARQQ